MFLESPYNFGTVIFYYNRRAVSRGAKPVFPGGKRYIVVFDDIVNNAEVHFEDVLRGRSERVERAGGEDMWAGNPSFFAGEGGLRRRKASRRMLARPPLNFYLNILLFVFKNLDERLIVFIHDYIDDSFNIVAGTYMITVSEKHTHMMLLAEAELFSRA